MNSRNLLKIWFLRDFFVNFRVINTNQNFYAMDTLDEILDAVNNPQIHLNENFLNSTKIPKKLIPKILKLQDISNNLIQMQSDEVKWNSFKLRESGEKSYEVIEKLKGSLIDTLDESRKSQLLVKWMYGLTFSLGFSLIIVALYFGVKGQEVLAITFGGIGIISIIAFLVKDPPLKLQDSRSNYAQLTVGMLGWFSDMLNKSGMEVFNQQLNILIQNDHKLDILQKIQHHKDLTANYLTISNTQINNTIKLLKLIDEVAEPGNSINAKNTVKEMEKIVEKAKETIQKPD